MRSDIKRPTGVELDISKEPENPGVGTVLFVTENRVTTYGLLDNQKSHGATHSNGVKLIVLGKARELCPTSFRDTESNAGATALYIPVVELLPGSGELNRQLEFIRLEELPHLRAASPRFLDLGYRLDTDVAKETLRIFGTD